MVVDVLLGILIVSSAVFVVGTILLNYKVSKMVATPAPQDVVLKKV